MSYPTFTELRNASDPAHLFRARPALRARIPIILLFLVSLAGVAVIVSLAKGGHLPFLQGWPSRALTVIPVAVLLEIVRRYYDELFDFGLHSMTSHHGRLSLSYSIATIKYVDIRAIDVTQSIWGRLLNFGSIEISTAAQEVGTLRMFGIVDPWQLAGLIDQLRNYSRDLTQQGEDVVPFVATSE